MYLPMSETTLAHAVTMWMKRVSNGNVIIMETFSDPGIRVEAYCSNCKESEDVTTGSDETLWPKIEKFCKDHQHFVAKAPAKQMTAHQPSVFVEATGRKFKEI